MAGRERGHARLRIAFVGCVEFSASALEVVLRHPDAEVVAVVTRSRSPANSDFRSLAPLARRAGVPVLALEEGGSAAVAGFLVRHEPDVAYCFGWSHLLSKEVLAVPRLGVVGYHPAALPRNRGRHPIIWALALGLERTASTFFFMDEGADSGDILDQEPLAISPRDDAGTLYRRLVRVAAGQIRRLTSALARGTYRRRRQDPRRANTWRKRSREDGRIDWRMSSRAIHDLVRALARPYPGAHFLHDGREVRVWRTRILPPARGARNLEPGRVIGRRARGLVVKTGDGAILLLDHELGRAIPRPGSYL